MRWKPRLVLALVLSLGMAPLARADTDFGPGFAFYEKQAKEVLKTAGTKVWECADDARKSGFHEFAIQQAERALGFDPDQKEAREYLKFVKKDGKWVRDEEAWNSPGFPKQNQRAGGQKAESQESFDKRLKKWEEESLAKANKFVAARYAELGQICDQKGHPDQAVKGYEAALRLDKDNATARKGLGYTKFGKVWLTKKQDEARKAAAKSEVVKETNPSIWEDALGKKFNKVETVHFRFESTYPVEELKLYADSSETAYAYFLADFERDPTEDVYEGHRRVFVVLSDDAQWNTFVDKFGGPDKEFTRQLAGCHAGDAMGVRSQKGSTVESRRDMIVHQVAHSLGQVVWKVSGRAWLNEGLAYYYTLKVLESCLTHCVSLKKGDYANSHQDEGGLKDWGDPASWKPLLKGRVQKKDDAALRAVMSLPITKLQFEETVKSWSVVSWMMDTNREKFMQMLDRLMDPSVKQEDVVQNVWEKGLEDLDEEWRRYVKKSY